MDALNAGVGSVLLVLGALAVTAIGFAMYFLPSLIALGRDIRSGGGVVVVNLLLGWTLLGWLVALVWACAGQTNAEWSHEVEARNALIRLSRREVPTARPASGDWPP